MQKLDRSNAVIQLEEAALCFNTVINSNNDHIEALNNLSLLFARWNKYVFTFYSKFS